MDEIIVDGISYNVYFIMDCTPEDDDVFVNKAFKRKAKIWHPDKMPLQDRNDPVKFNKQQHRFKVLVESYEYITSRRMFSSNQKSREQIDVRRNDNLSIGNFNDNDELRSKFNQEFDKSRPQNPNDFGYKTDRMVNIEDYENQDFTPIQIFDPSKFNPNDFNKAFEYSQKQTSPASNELGLYHRTNDGFSAYNSGDLGGAACVSSYNGVMIVGDNFGDSGKGYYDTNYSDYKMSYEMSKNPDSQLNIPDDFRESNRTTVPLTEAESRRQLELQMQYRSMNIAPEGSGSKHDFKLQEQLFLEKQEQEMLAKIENDKKFILQYKDMYDNQTIEGALNRNLVSSKDYVSENDISKRNLRTSFK